MSIDPARLARIRARLLAAATLAVPACGGANEQAPDRPPSHHDGPINERPVDEPRLKPTAAPSATAPTPDDGPTINTPPPLPEHPQDINRPNPDAVKKPPSPKDLPPSGQTINTAPAPAPMHHINTPPPKL